LTDSSDQEEQAESADRKPLNPVQVVSSVVAAGLGVQSSRNRERDFKQGRAGVFIAAGLVFTILFVGALVVIVQLVLRSSGQ
jgi:hypothetical protein